MIRDRQHGPVVELNRMQVRRSRARPAATAAAASGHKTVFSQMASKMALLGAEALLLPHRVWKVKFVGECRRSWETGRSLRRSSVGRQRGWWV